MTEIVTQQLVNWLVFASIYTLIAIGFTLLFGVLNIIHFSHGDVAILAAFVTLLLAGAVPDAGWLVAALIVVAGIAITGALGLAVERVLIRPFRLAPPLIVLVVTVAFGIVIREGIRLFYPQGGNPHSFPTPFRESVLSLGGARLTLFAVIVILITASLLLGLFLFLKHTAIGTRIRAVAQDAEAARMMGIDTDRAIAATFLLASLIGGVAGLFFASYVGILRFDIGIVVGLKGFAAAVVGGLGSIYGAVVGALLLAGVETLAMALVPGGTAYKEVFAFLLVIVFLVFRPAGIVGAKVYEKV